MRRKWRIKHLYGVDFSKVSQEDIRSQTYIFSGTGFPPFAPRLIAFPFQHLSRLADSFEQQM